MADKQRLADQLHDDMHRIPGMPTHDRAAALNSRSRPSKTHATSHPAHQNAMVRHDDPKVLVRWQRFIGRLFGRD